MIDEPLAFRNAYDLRNEFTRVHAADCRYVLHLNSDIVAAADAPTEQCHWLRELVRRAESRPDAWAVMPILLERMPCAPLRMHAWWASVTRQVEGGVYEGGGTARPTLHARFDLNVCSTPIAALPEMLQHRQPLFLEECVPPTPS